MAHSYSEFLRFALDLVRVAEDRILPHYQDCAVSLKPDGTEVTEADRQAERAMRERIEEVYPKHGILGEEFGARDTGEDGYQWVIDPVDGTAWFTLGMPTFGTPTLPMRTCVKSRWQMPT